jgi:hypothetical protein
MPVVVKSDVGGGRTLENEVDDDIEAFDKYFQSLGNDPLNKFERAVVKTYLHWKTHGEPCPGS